MSAALELFNLRSDDSVRDEEGRGHPPLLPPPTAWRILHRRTGGRVSRSTFYRWLESGKIYSLRMGNRIYIPWQTLQEIIQRCLEGAPI
jgi:excisionase family DNA binding protein